MYYFSIVIRGTSCQKVYKLITFDVNNTTNAQLNYDNKQIPLQLVKSPGNRLGNRPGIFAEFISDQVKIKIYRNGKVEMRTNSKCPNEYETGFLA